MSLRNLSNQCWPSIVDIETAKKASQQGLWASSLIAGVTVAFVLLGMMGHSSKGFDGSALWDAGVFIIIGWGIFKSSRSAAVAGLILYLMERAYMWATVGPKNPIVAIIFILAFINSIRGTFAFHRFSRGLEPDQTNSTVIPIPDTSSSEPATFLLAGQLFCGQCRLAITSGEMHICKK